MTILFVAGSGTDIGKTFVTERLIGWARARNRAVRAIKTVASGVPDRGDPAFAQTDTARLLRALGSTIDEATVAACSPWRFKAPLSPDMAAAAEGRALSLQDVVQWTQTAVAQTAENALTLIEGVGGVMSPVCDDATNLDLICALRSPALLVVGSYLGAISHCLTSIEAMKARNVRLAAVVLNESAEPAIDLDATAASIRRFAPNVRLLVIRRNAQDASADFDKILACAHS